MKIIYLICVLGIALTLAAQGDPSIPDQGGGTQPKSCDNGFDTPKESKCDCSRAQQECDPRTDYSSHDSVSYNCKTYCRPEACGCVNPCMSMTQ